MLVTLLIALASIIIGELVPKTLALTFAERFALVVARPIGWLDRLLRPDRLAGGRAPRTCWSALLGGRDRPQAGYLSTEELKMLVETGSEQGGIEQDEKEMIHGVIELAETKVHEVMVPRIGIRAVDVNDPIDEVLDIIVRAGHSRLPVYEENLDDIIGILYAKDLLPYLQRQRQPPQGDRPAQAGATRRSTCRRRRRSTSCCTRCRSTKRHIAIVVDEYGGTAGLITMEDVVEEIVGEIQDEYDREESLVEPLEQRWRAQLPAGREGQHGRPARPVRACPMTRRRTRRRTTRSAASSSTASDASRCPARPSRSAT